MGHYDCPCMGKCPLQHAMLLIGGNDAIVYEQPIAPSTFRDEQNPIRQIECEDISVHLFIIIKVLYSATHLLKAFKSKLASQSFQP